MFSNEMNLSNPQATDGGTQFNAAPAQLLEKFRPIAFAETCLFLMIQLLEFQEIWPKNSLETTWLIYHEKSEFWHGEFSILEKTIYGELQKSPCQNLIRTVLTEGISCQFVVGEQWTKSYDWIFLKY